jgi:hypothetical protein
MEYRRGSGCAHPRGWDQSDRFDQAWAIVAAFFHTEVTVLANVTVLRPTTPSAPERHDENRTHWSHLGGRAGPSIL